MSSAPSLPARARVVLMIGTLERGGGEQQLVTLAQRLDPRRFDVRVCCLTSGGPLADTLVASAIPVDVLGWHGLPPFRGFGVVRGGAALGAIIARLSRYFRQHRPHIVQGQLFWAYVLGALAAVPARVPVTITCRRSLPIFKGGNTRHLWLERLANRVTTLVVANSDVVRQTAIETEGLDPRRILTIHNGADAAPASRQASDAVRAELGLPADALVVTCVANLIEYKGHRDLLDAWATVRRSQPNAELLLVGDGPERADVETTARTVGGVRVLGSRGDVPAILGISTVLVQASHQEGLPNAVLEAMTAGLPVVATDVGGTRELVADGETGRLVAARDARGLAQALIDLLGDAPRRAHMGDAARVRAQTRFSADAMVAKYQELYVHLLAEAGR